MANPIVESTEITDAPTCTFSNDLVLGVILNVPSIEVLLSYPTKSEILKYWIPLLVNISTADIDAFVETSSLLNNVCPINFVGSPDIASATTISLLINSASEGFRRYFSRLITYGFSPYRTLNKILNDSSVPLEL